MLLAAGCGGEEPSLAIDLAEQLAASSDAAATLIESAEFCAARERAIALQNHAVEAINAGVVPADVQEELLGSVTGLADAISCRPPEAEDGAAEDARALADWLRERSD